MITMVMVVAAQILISVNCLENKNPVKLSVSLLLLATLLFWQVSYVTGKTMMPTIIYLMFMGGILMTFMIISAVTPSAKMSKIEKGKNTMMMGVLVLFGICWELTYFNCKSTEEMANFKGMIVYFPMMLMMIAILLLYFFSMMSMISSSKSNLRTLSWCL